MNAFAIFGLSLGLVFALFALTAALVGYQLLFPPPSYADVVMRRTRRQRSEPVPTGSPEELWQGPGHARIVDRAAEFIAHLVPPEVLDWMRPRLQAAGQRQSPELVLGEALTATVLLAGALLAVALAFHFPLITIGLALGVPAVWWLRVSSRLAEVRREVEAEVSMVLVVAASVARSTSGLDGPRGLLPYLISEIDCTFCDLLHEAVIDASARGVMVEEVLEEMGAIYRLSVLVTVAGAFRAWRRQGVGLGRAMASAANAVMETQLSDALRRTYVRNTVSVLPVAIFDLPALLLLLLTPALSRLFNATGLFTG